MDNFENKSIILFDGVCNLCNASVNFVVKHDKKEQFLFASFQSDAAKEIMLHFNLKNLKLDSIVLIEGEKIYEKSTAILKIARHLNNGSKFLYFFIVIPKSIRNWLYNAIAKHRYLLFGKRESCMVPSLELKKRFLD